MNYLVATKDFEVTVDDVRVSVKRGVTRIAADHALARLRPDAFQPEAGATIRRLATRSENTEGIDLSRGRTSAEPDRHREAREVGLRAIERASGSLSAAAGDRLAGLVERDRQGADSRYLAAVSDPSYERAFAKIIAQPQTAHQLFTEDEGRAVRVVNEALAERAMLEGTPSLGGYGVPFQLDPTITLSSDGSLNPIRQLATVITIATNEWKGVSSQGVTASWDPEATEVSDDTPTLDQPSIRAEKAAAFVPFSIEVGQDYATLQQELATLFADAKDQLEASAFIGGAGSSSNEPEGLVSGLDSSSVVDTASSGAFQSRDIFSLQEALPPRFQARASWLSSNSIANRIYRFVPPGSTTEAILLNEDRTRLLGKQWNEASEVSSTVSAGEKILVYGSIADAFKVVDRVGLTVELIPHLFHTANQRPYGMRALYAYWRVGAGVVVDNAARVLRIKA